MSITLLIPPEIEPLSLNEAKNFLRVEHDEDDILIATLVSAARNHVEAMTRRGLLLQTWRIILDEWPRDGRIRTRLGPLRDVVAARVRDDAGNADDMDTGIFIVDGEAGVIAAPAFALPAPGRNTRGIELDVTIGFGTAATDVPAVLRLAVRTLTAHWYDNRALVAIGGSVAMMPLSVHAMVSSYRVLSL